MTSTKSLKVAFVHPDLGIGGAERLVVDAAKGLKSRGHNVVVYTSHHDTERCFAETKDGTLQVRVRGNTIIPRTFSGSFYMVCAILRQLHLTLSMIIGDRERYDVIFVDQLSACIPLLRMTGAKVLFYCHFPDKLLTQRDTTLKNLYRIPIDFIEGLTTGKHLTFGATHQNQNHVSRDYAVAFLGMADCVVVNSKFTSNVFCQSFNIGNPPQVLYPGIHLETYDRKVDNNNESVKVLETSKTVILSINRFERKKNIVIAIRAFAWLRDDKMVDPTSFENMRLIIAGGYDYRVQENVEHHSELNKVALQCGLKTYTIMPDSSKAPPETTQVVFLCSFNEAQRTYLLSKALCLLYTPENEHFGITPIEAMYSRLPVISCNSGGPKETIRDGETGVLSQPRPMAFAEAMAAFVNGEYDRKAMGERGRVHVQKSFSLEVFTASLENLLIKLTTEPSKSIWNPLLWLSTMIALTVFLFSKYFG
ncbi:13519_t:CDS:2 [Acaulospora colombiana]|uniref:13519_t:CDS:1 n=1 Tax=Acaulospora colombiana TaxID=27376 RepID=A0ACA9K6W4_9GLOM|nr:13519_t:CDS:2 [Acaulospora colombiana]